MTRVLLAEDHGFSRDLLARRLERSGFEVIAASNGRDAVDAARRHHPDLILMDLNMPGLGGHGAIRILKNDPHTDRIPIIVVSGSASPEDVAKVVQAGCQAFESKPMVMRRLLERIQEVLERQLAAGSGGASGGGSASASTGGSASSTTGASAGGTTGGCSTGTSASGTAGASMPAPNAPAEPEDPGPVP